MLGKGRLYAKGGVNGCQKVDHNMPDRNLRRDASEALQEIGHPVPQSGPLLLSQTRLWGCDGRGVWGICQYHSRAEGYIHLKPIKPRWTDGKGQGNRLFHWMRELHIEFAGPLAPESCPCKAAPATEDTYTWQYLHKHTSSLVLCRVKLKWLMFNQW